MQKLRLDQMTPRPTFLTAGLGGFSNAKALYGIIVGNDK